MGNAKRRGRAATRPQPPGRRALAIAAALALVVSQLLQALAPAAVLAAQSGSQTFDYSGSGRIVYFESGSGHTAYCGTGSGEGPRHHADRFTSWDYLGYMDVGATTLPAGADAHALAWCIANGYPNRSASELGCDDPYKTTQMAQWIVVGRLGYDGVDADGLDLLGPDRVNPPSERDLAAAGRFMYPEERLGFPLLVIVTLRHRRVARAKSCRRHEAPPKPRYLR